MKTSKMLDGYPQRSCAAATLPPFARPSPLTRAALPRRYADPRSASLRSGDGRPRFGHGPAADAAGRGLRRGRLSSPRQHACGVLGGLRVELARGALARLRLGRCPRRPRGPVPCGQSGPREDRRGSSRRSAALSWPPAAAPPCGLRVGARAEMRYAAARREPTPPPIRAQATPSLTRVVQIRLTADFQRRLSVRAFPGHFSGSFRRFGGYKCPPRLHFTQKMASKGAARPPATRPECPATRETRGHLLNGGLPARRGLWTAPGTVPTARTRSGLGSRLSALRGMVSQSSRNN